MADTITVNWNGNVLKLTWIPEKYPNNTSKVTSVHGYCFDATVDLIFLEDM